MNRPSLRPSLAMVALAAALLPSAAPAQSITPVSQNRLIRAFTIVPPCAPGTVFNSLQAPDFGLFSHVVTSDLFCDPTLGHATTSQESRFFSPTVITAGGEAISQGAATTYTVIHAFSDSIFDATFDISAEAQFDVTGNLVVRGGAPVQVVTTHIDLFDAAGATLFHRSLDGSSNGSTVTQTFSQRGYLSAGRHRLWAVASTALDSSIPPSGFGDASFFIYFIVRPPCRPDWDHNGLVQPADVGSFVNDWFLSLTQGTLAGDFDGDGIITPADIAAFINAWIAGLTGGC